MYFAPTAVPGSMTVNSNLVSWDMPCVFIVYPYVFHSQMETDGKDHERYYFSFNRRTLSAFDKRILPSVLTEDNCSCLYTFDTEVAEELRGIISSVMNRRDTASEKEKELTFLLFMTRLEQLCHKDNVQRTEAKFSYIHDVMKYIMENHSNRLTSDDLARRFAISRSKLERNFREMAGQSVHHFIDDCRMKDALKRIIAPSFTSVHKVAEECGFENETYFYLFFKKHTAMSPLEYRNLKLNGNKSASLSDKDNTEGK